MYILTNKLAARSVLLLALIANLSVASLRAENCSVPKGPILHLIGNKGAIGLQSGKVFVWKDVSGKANDFRQPMPARRPTLGSVNGHPVVHFDGLDDFLTSSKPVGASLTVVAMIRTNAGGISTSTEAYNPPATVVGNQTFWAFSALGLGGFNHRSIRYVWTDTNPAGNKTHSAGSSIFPAINDGRARMIAVTHDAGPVKDGHSSKVTVYRDGVVPTTITAIPPPSSSQTVTEAVLSATSVGAGYKRLSSQLQQSAAAYHYAADFFKGDVGEVIVYDRVLSPSEIKAIHCYMKEFWGVQ